MMFTFPSPNSAGTSRSQVTSLRAQQGLCAVSAQPGPNWFNFVECQSESYSSLWGSDSPTTSTSLSVAFSMFNVISADACFCCASIVAARAACCELSFLIATDGPCFVPLLEGMLFFAGRPADSTAFRFMLVLIWSLQRMSKLLIHQSSATALEEAPVLMISRIQFGCRYISTQARNTAFNSHCTALDALGQFFQIIGKSSDG